MIEKRPSTILSGGNRDDEMRCMALLVEMGCRGSVPRTLIAYRMGLSAAEIQRTTKELHVEAAAESASSCIWYASRQCKEGTVRMAYIASSGANVGLFTLVVVQKQRRWYNC